MKKKIEFDFSPKTKPLSHQVEAIEYVKTHDVVPLFDEQGLGKSKIVIDALCKNIEDKIIDGVLIICKKSLLYTWKREIDTHSHLYSVIIDGTKHYRGRALLTYGHFYICNYDSVVQDYDTISLLLTQKFAIVLDESQIIKNPEANVTKTILQMRNMAKKRIIITGTPIANRPDDIWSQFYFLDGGKLLGNDYTSFKKKYKINLKGVDPSEYESRLKQLHDKIFTISIRRTKNVLELPEKKFINIHVKLTPKQAEIYEVARKQMLLEITDANGASVIENIDNYLEKLLRLTQIASNPELIDKKFDEDPSKFIELDRIVDNIISKKDKVIIWTSFVKNIKVLCRRYDRYGARMIYGEMTIIDREQSMKRFMHDESCKVLIANPSAAKEGLTLTSANHAIYLDRTFKMDDYLQSQDRIHRIGQTKECNIIKLIATNTIDEYTDEILEKKESVAKFALGDITELKHRSHYLSKEDLMRILGEK